MAGRILVIQRNGEIAATVNKSETTRSDFRIRASTGGAGVRGTTFSARLYDVAVIGVSNVGWMTGGPWRGRKCIGRSLAIGPGGEILAQGPYGEDAETLVVVDVELRPPVGRGTDLGAALRARGYHGP